MAWLCRLSWVILGSCWPGSLHRAVTSTWVASESIHGCAGLLGALGALKECLTLKGSNLVVRYGALPQLLRELVLESGAAEIIAEEEVEHRWS